MQISELSVQVELYAYYYLFSVTEEAWLMKIFELSEVVLRDTSLQFILNSLTVF